MKILRSSLTKEQFSTRRIEALTDGVFAIAMTLLVLDIKVNDFGDLISSKQLYDALLSTNSSIISFAISFLLLGSMWAVHTRQFEYIKRGDRHLTMINTLRLLAVVLIPLTTSIAGTYSDLVLGRILFPLNFLILAILSRWQWDYAIKMPGNDIDPRILSDSSKRNQVIMATSAGVVILSIWLGEAAFSLFFFTPLFMKLANRAKSANH